MAHPLFHEAGPARRPATLTPERFAREFPAETEHVEFGRTLLAEHVHENVTAFSNSGGGVILIGVRHDGAVVGQDANEATLERLHGLVAQVRDPAGYALHPVTVGDTPIVVLAVGHREEGFAQTPDGRLLVRRGGSNVRLLGTELADFVAAQQPALREATAVGPTFADADPNLIESVRRSRRWTVVKLPERFHEAGLLTAPSKDAPLTVAGALVLLPDAAGTLGLGGVEVVRFDDDGAPREPRTLTGPAHVLIDEASRAVLEAFGTDSVTVREQPHELPRLPEPAVHEAIANAVIHRSYEPGTGPVRVEIHPDRVVVRSPGGLPGAVTLDNLRQQHAPRNPALAETLLRLGVTEVPGSGVDAIIEAMAAHLLDAPTFADDGEHVTVELSSASETSPQERAWVAEMSQRAAESERGPLADAERALLLMALRGEVLTNAKVRDAIDVDVPTAR
ncbi:MAG: hypothetical protein GX593_09590, partial [Actinomycetales bacterium]|nr:hypothetical protein [Actinomycetales bacterium]